MMDILLKKFIKNQKDYNDPDVRNKIGSLASWSGIILNILLVIGKVLAGFVSGSMSIIADGINNLMDAIGSVITLIGFKLSRKKADKEHPFGHGRYEYVAGLAVAVLVLLVGIELGRTSIAKVINPTIIDFGWLPLVILVISIILKLWMRLFIKNLGQRINSTALIAVSVDSRNDAIATSAVLITAFISQFANIKLDGWASLGVAIFIIYNGVILIKETISPILGESPSDELVNYITKKIESYECVIGLHDLIVHDYGPGKQYASAHLELSSDIDPLVSHAVLDKIEKEFLEKDNIHMVIHYDPV
ncbi:MAG: cation transporter [Clostridiales bacterium]|nr:cation transporter [Clostridiales bacterium]